MTPRDFPLKWLQAVALSQPLWDLYSLHTTRLDSKALIQKWRTLKHGLEHAATEPGQAAGWLRWVYRLPEFRHFNRVSKQRYLATPEGRAKRKEWDRAKYHRRNTPEYREAKRAYDRERYHLKKETK